MNVRLPSRARWRGDILARTIDSARGRIRREMPLPGCCARGDYWLPRGRVQVQRPATRTVALTYVLTAPRARMVVPSRFAARLHHADVVFDPGDRRI